MKTDAPSKYILIMPIAMLVYTIAARYIYFMPWKYHYDTPPYVSELFPIPEIGTMIMLIFLMVLIFRWKASFAWLFTLIILISGSAIDKFSIVSKLYENPYGPVFPEPKIISHYSLVELKSAKWLNNYLRTPKSILISDPYTLSIFEAVTGNNGFYTFSNIGVMKKEYELEVKIIFRGFFPPLNGQYLYGAVDYNNKKTYVYGLSLEGMQKGGPEAFFAVINISANKTDRINPEQIFNIIWIVSEKTINWAYGDDVGYYPQNKPFSKKYIAKYINPYFETIYNANNQILILQLK